MSVIGDNLRTLRTLKRMTQAELAANSNVSKTYINRIERGVFENPSFDVLNKLAKALNCSVRDLGCYEHQELDKRANSTIDTMLLNNDPDCSVSNLILNKLLKEKLINENFMIDDEFKEILEDAIKLDAKLNDNLKKKGSLE